MKTVRTGLALPLMCPDNGVGLVGYDHGDVLVPFAVAGLIDADNTKPVQTVMQIRLDVLMYTGYDPANGVPGNTYIGSYSTLIELGCQPCGTVLELFGKSGIMECPGNAGNDHAVVGAGDTRADRFNVDKHPAKVKGTPSARKARVVIAQVSLTEMRAMMW